LDEIIELFRSFFSRCTLLLLLPLLHHQC